MKRRIAIGVFLVFTSATAIAHAQQGSAADEAAIKDLAKQYSSAWNSGDAAKAASVYADDGTFVNVVGMELKGRAAIEKNMMEELAGALKGSTFAVTMDSVRFIRPDLALVQGTTNITGGDTPPEGLKGHYLLVAAKRAGSWKVLAVHTAAMPPAAPQK